MSENRGVLPRIILLPKMWCVSSQRNSLSLRIFLNFYFLLFNLQNRPAAGKLVLEVFPERTKREGDLLVHRLRESYPIPPPMRRGYPFEKEVVEEKLSKTSSPVAGHF